jgi:hypothetical protein
MSKVFLGDSEWSGAKSAGAWKQFGYNVDGLVSSAESTDLCLPRAGGKKVNVYPDGDNGTDNSWGKNVMPMVTGVAPEAAPQANEQIAQGAVTHLFHLTDLGSSSDYNPILARGYAGAQKGSPPSFDGSDVWPIKAESLAAPPDVATALVQFPQSYVVGNVWVSGVGGGVLEVSLGVGFATVLKIHRPLVTIELAPDHQSSTRGVISGVLDVEELIVDIEKTAGQLSPDLCQGSTIESIANQLRQAADIMKDGTQNPALECDGISIGIGFEARAVQLGPVASPEPPAPDPCADP